jgi:hypothetical protein
MGGGLSMARPSYHVIALRAWPEPLRLFFQSQGVSGQAIL